MSKPRVDPKVATLFQAQIDLMNVPKGRPYKEIAERRDRLVALLSREQAAYAALIGSAICRVAERALGR